MIGSKIVTTLTDGTGRGNTHTHLSVNLLSYLTWFLLFLGCFQDVRTVWLNDVTLLKMNMIIVCVCGYFMSYSPFKTNLLTMIIAL